MANEETPDIEEELENNEKLAGPLLIGLLYVSLISLSIIVLYSLIMLWPILNKEAKIPYDMPFFFKSYTIATKETGFLLIIALAGALGSSARALLALNENVKKNIVSSRSIPGYLTKPLKGTLLGVIFYLIIKGGFFPAAKVEEASPFTFIGIACLVGLFMDHALSKLEQIVESVFAAPKD